MKIKVVDFHEIFSTCKKLNEIRENSGDRVSYVKRMYSVFNNFFIVKFLNYLHCEYIEKVDVCRAANDLLKKVFNAEFKDVEKTLDFMKKLQNNRPVILPQQ